LPDLVRIVPIEGAAAHSISAAAQSAAIVHRMRLQLQDDTMIAGHTYGITRTNNPTPGVTVLQMQNALSELYQTVAAGAPWFPLRLLPQLVGAIVYLSKRLTQYPPAGTTASGNIETSHFF
jgi:hypothetical protein